MNWDHTVILLRMWFCGLFALWFCISSVSPFNHKIQIPSGSITQNTGSESVCQMKTLHHYFPLVTLDRRFGFKLPEIHKEIWMKLELSSRIREWGSGILNQSSTARVRGSGTPFISLIRLEHSGWSLFTKTY